MRYFIVSRKRGHAVVDMTTGLDVASGLTLGSAKALVAKRVNAEQLRMRWLTPEFRIRK